MSAEQPRHLDVRTQEAVRELQETISARYPTATFAVSRAPDDQNSLLLLVTVDVEDPDEVGDLVLDRVIQLQVDEQISLHVIPIRTPGRIHAAQPVASGIGRQRFRHDIPLFEALPTTHR